MTKKRYGHTIQLWPGGGSVTYDGENKETRRILKGGRWRKPTAQENYDIEVELLAEHYQQTEIWCLDSCLISDAMQAGQSGEVSGEFAREWDYDKVTNLTADPSDWDVDQCHEWLTDNGEDCPDPNPWAKEGEDDDREELLRLLDLDPDDAELFSDEQKAEYRKFKRMNIEKLRAEVVQRIDNEDIAGLDDWREAVRDRATEHQQEPYEWYRVSDWFAKRLMDIGECVLDNNYGYWWGRTCTGQGNIMDGTLQAVARLHLGRVESFAA